VRISYTPEQESLRRELRSYFAQLMTRERREAMSSTQGEYGTGDTYKDIVRQMGPTAGSPSAGQKSTAARHAR